LSGLAFNGYLVAGKGYFAHLDFYQVGGLVFYLGGYNTTESFDLKILFSFGVAFLKQIPRKNPQAVTTFFSFAAVRIKNPQFKWVIFVDRPIKNTIGTDTEISVANQLDRFRFQINIKNIRVNHQIVIAQTVIFIKVRQDKTPFGKFLSNENSKVNS
jgi:hypothetical protein